MAGIGSHATYQAGPGASLNIHFFSPQILKFRHCFAHFGHTPLYLRHTPLYFSH
jgi:hypothetical protein